MVTGSNRPVKSSTTSLHDSLVSDWWVGAWVQKNAAREHQMWFLEAGQITCGAAVESYEIDNWQQCVVTLMSS